MQMATVSDPGFENDKKEYIMFRKNSNDANGALEYNQAIPNEKLRVRILEE